MTADQSLQLASEHQAAGRAGEARAICQKILTSEPNHPAALRLLGAVCLGMGQLAESAAAFRRVIQLQPMRADGYNNLANVLMGMGNLQEAVSMFAAAARLAPSDATVQCNLGFALTSVGRFDEAMVALNRAIEIDPNDAESHNNLGIAQKESKLIAKAISSYRRAIELKPNYAEAYNNLGNALRANQQTDEAAAAYLRAIEFKANYAEAYNNLANFDAAEGRFEQAITAYKRAIQINPKLFEAHVGLGKALIDSGGFSEALEVYDRALRLKSDDPELRLNRSLLLLMHGDFARGLPEYEWRWKVKGLVTQRPFAQPVWDGRDLNGKAILIHNEQGFGDTIQCLRFIPLIAARGGRIIVGCPPPLVRLLAQLPDISRIVTDGDPMPDFDFHCPMMTLPLVFKTDLRSIPPPIILKPDPATAEAWRQKLAVDPSPRKIGLSWAGNPSHVHDQNRSMNLSQFAPLAQIRETSFYSLQFGEGAKQSPPPGLILRDFTSELKDFADTAALIANLDLVLTVDTAVAHLAGSMGKPVWVLLPFKPDWRWMLRREDSPWYPTMRLIRQTAVGDWQNVILRVRELLQEYTIPA
jgi:Flp pilus assembly protein TadD